MYINTFTSNSSTYDHRVWKTGLPVRSAVLKPHAGRLVVGWVTTSESRLLYVFVFLASKASMYFILQVKQEELDWVFSYVPSPEVTVVRGSENVPCSATSSTVLYLGRYGQGKSTARYVQEYRVSCG